MINTMVARPLNYGLLSDASSCARMPDCLIKAAEVFNAQSGKFVKADGTDDHAVAGSGDTQLTGWASIKGGTEGATGYTVPAAATPTYKEIITDINARFLMPADAAVTRAIRGLTCDLIVASNIQKADVGESNEDVIVIYDINIALQLVEVGLNASKMWATGVA